MRFLQLWVRPTEEKNLKVRELQTAVVRQKPEKPTFPAASGAAEQDPFETAAKDRLYRLYLAREREESELFLRTERPDGTPIEARLGRTAPEL